jgi:hypothetical protein
MQILKSRININTELSWYPKISDLLFIWLTDKVMYIWTSAWFFINYISDRYVILLILLTDWPSDWFTSNLMIHQNFWSEPETGYPQQGFSQCVLLCNWCNSILYSDMPASSTFLTNSPPVIILHYTVRMFIAYGFHSWEMCNILYTIKLSCT